MGRGSEGGGVPRFCEGLVFVRARLQPCRKQALAGLQPLRERYGGSETSCSNNRDVLRHIAYLESRAIFTAVAACEIFVESLLDYRDEGAFEVEGFVLTPDHFHVLITPGPNTALERAVQFIKDGSARRIGEAFNFRFPVWQRGFSDHRIRDAADYPAHARYLEQNPVKRKLVVSPAEYRWSSASGAFAMNEVPQGLKPLRAESAERHG